MSGRRPFGRLPRVTFPTTPPEPRRAPSSWWFAVGAGLIVVGLLIGAIAFWQAISSFNRIDATVSADGEVHSVRITHEPETRRLVWSRSGGSVSCTYADPRTDESLAPRSLSNTDFTRGRWEGVETFAGGRERLDVRCDESSADIQIGPEPSFAGFFGGLAIGIGTPIVLGLAGLAVLIVTGVKRSRATLR